MEAAMNTDEKLFGKREVFLSIGCAKYPYNRVKELFGENESLDLKSLAQLQIGDDEKVQVIQETGFFSDALSRILALRFATETYRQLSIELSELEQEMAVDGLKVLTEIILGETARNAFESHRLIIQAHINQVLKTDVNKHFRRIATLENILSVVKSTATQSLVESSSIQRDVLGESIGTWQLETMLLLSQNYQKD